MSKERLFYPCETLKEFNDQLIKFQLDGYKSLAPVLIEKRTDLLSSIELAEQLYTSLQKPALCSYGVMLSDSMLPALQDFAQPLAKNWIDETTAIFIGGPLLIIGRYSSLTSYRVQKLIENAYKKQQDLFIITGRDDCSLSWMIAKQYCKISGNGVTGLFTELDMEPSIPGIEWFSPQDLQNQDIKSIILNRKWQRVLFHGNGKDDSLNLGQFTICGRSTAGEFNRGSLGPKCAYGFGCYKPEDKLIPAHKIQAAELVLANCFSGPLYDHSMYDPKYGIMLNALDGPAQTVIATLTACDAQRPENLAWLSKSIQQENIAKRINTSVADINPYPCFIQIGIPNYPKNNEVVNKQNLSNKIEYHTILSKIGTRLSGLLDSGLLQSEHPLQEILQPLKENLLQSINRIKKEEHDKELPNFLSSSDIRSVDLALAQRLAKYPDDPLLNFPTYFGERSIAESPKNNGLSCACGKPLLQYLRRGKIPVIINTMQAVCARCGDVVNSFEDSVELHAQYLPLALNASTFTVSIQVISTPEAVVNVGIALPVYLHAVVLPNLRQAKIDISGSTIVTFEIEVSPLAAPQAYYFIPFAVHHMGITALRCHFNILLKDREKPAQDHIND